MASKVGALLKVRALLSIVPQRSIQWTRGEEKLRGLATLSPFKTILKNYASQKSLLTIWSERSHVCPEIHLLDAWSVSFKVTLSLSATTFHNITVSHWFPLLVLRCYVVSLREGVARTFNVDFYCP